MSPLIRSTLVGGVIAFIWIMFSWMALPFHEKTIGNVSNERQVMQSVLSGTTENGVYVIPAMDPENAKNRGPQPFVFLNVHRNIDFSSMAGSMVISLITQFVGALIITAQLLKTTIKKYWDRVCFVTMSGLLVAILGMMPFFTWWKFPIGWVFVGMLDYVIAWFLAGLAMARLSQK